MKLLKIIGIFTVLKLHELVYLPARGILRVAGLGIAWAAIHAALGVQLAIKWIKNWFPRWNRGFNYALLILVMFAVVVVALPAPSYFKNQNHQHVIVVESRVNPNYMIRNGDVQNEKDVESCVTEWKQAMPPDIVRQGYIVREDKEFRGTAHRVDGAGAWARNIEVDRESVLGATRVDRFFMMLTWAISLLVFNVTHVAWLHYGIYAELWAFLQSNWRHARAVADGKASMFNQKKKKSKRKSS